MGKKEAKCIEYVSIYNIKEVGFKPTTSERMLIMNKDLKPTYMFEAVQDISVDFLKKESITAILLDIDNTIITGSFNMTKKVDTWLRSVTKAGIQICILSNTWNFNKVKKLMLKYDINGLPRAKKPRVKGFNMAYNVLGVPKENMVMIGDQIFTDVLGANRFGIRSIYVKPITRVEWWGTAIKRPFEYIVLKSLNNKKGEKNKC